MSQQNAQILFPVNVPGAFDYAVPDDMRVDRGDIVYAPIGKQMKLGVVMSVGAAEEGRDLKEIAEIKATRPLPTPMLDFIDWVARYNVASPGQVLRMVLRSWKALDPSPIATLYQPTGQRPATLTPASRPRAQKSDATAAHGASSQRLRPASRTLLACVCVCMRARSRARRQPVGGLHYQGQALWQEQP